MCWSSPEHGQTALGTRQFCTGRKSRMGLFRRRVSRLSDSRLQSSVLGIWPKPEFFPNREFLHSLVREDSDSEMCK